jgi:tetratricopeptide (TPR) repeat protein
MIKIKPRPEYLMSLGTLYALTKDPLALAMGDLLMSPVGNAANQGLFIKGMYYNNIGEKENAIAFLDKCLSLDYSNLLAYREKAMAEYDLGKYLEALKTLELSLAVKKNYDEAYYWMGRCYEKLGKKQEAIDNYKMALQLSPDYVEPKDALGKMGVVQ